MRFLRKTKYRISLLVVMIMFLQIFMPAVGRVVFADETSSESIEQLIRDEQDISGESTGVEVTGENTPKEDDTSKDTINDKIDSKEVDSEEKNILGLSTPVSDFKFITDVKVTDQDGNPFEGKVASNSKIRIQYNYSLKDELEVDTSQQYSLKIPNEIRILNDTKISLKNGDGHLIATVNVDTNNNATIQFDKNVNEKGMYDRLGYFYVYSEFDSNKLGEGGETDIVFDLGGGNTQTITVNFEKVEQTNPGEGEGETPEEPEVNTPTRLIQKSGVYNYDTKRIDWTIEVNNNNLDISDIMIIDTIPEGLELVGDSVKLDGTAIGYWYNAGENGSHVLKYPINGSIDRKYTLTYSTEVVDVNAYNSNTPKTYNNHVKLEGKGVLENTSDEIGVSVPTYVIEKLGNGYKPSTQEITWIVRVNHNKIKIDKAVVEDKIPQGLEYVEGSFDIYEDGGPASDISSYGKFENKDGTIRYSFNNQINSSYILTFKTKVLDKNIWANNAYEYFSNTVELSGGNIPKSSATAQQEVSSEVIRKTGIGYDYLTREASWKIVINQNKIPINNAKIKDVIGQYQDFVEGSVKITGSNKENAKFNFDKDNKTLMVEFPGEIKDEQTIEFKTKIVDDSIFHTNKNRYVENTAILYGDEIPKDGVSSTDRNYIENTVAGKTGKYTNGNDFIDWEVLINQNQLPISNAVLEDTLQEGLELDTSSVKLIKLIVDKTGNYSEGEEVPLGDSNISYNPETRKFEFHFNEKINEAYLLKFKTDIDDAHNNATFTNTINFKGSSRAVEDTAEDIRVAFQTAGGGAGGSSRGSIKVVKVDKENNSQKLKGAVFELLDSYGNVIKTSGPTGEDGEALFKGLKYDTIYSIREKQSPNGYILSDEVYKFQVKNEYDKKDISYSFKNSKIKGDFKLLKVIKGTKTPLKDAKITVYKEDGNLVGEQVTNDSGYAKFENLPYGKYYYIETKAPSGYHEDSEKHYFNIIENGVTVEDILENTKIAETIPTKPTEPGNPVRPTNPIIPSNPEVVPNDPSNPKNPVTPSNPVIPSEPVTPSDPETPNSANSNNPQNSLSGIGGSKDDKINQIVENDKNTPNKNTKTDKSNVLPKTGEINSLVFYTAGIVLIISGVLFMRKKS